MTTLPRVLLVEDDASLRRWVEMVLEDEPIELVSCEDGAKALAELARAPVRLVLTDLMMPGVSGRELLERLDAEPGLGGGPLRVVFSAGLGATTRESLAGLGVWRWLHKPTSMAELLACVRDALQGAPIVAAASPSQDVIERHFGGDRGLFEAYRGSCDAQFALDADAGDAALAARDAQALRRLGHSLKSVLETLGETGGSAQARQLEGAAVVADWPTLEVQWPGFAAWLRARATGAG